MGQMHGAEETTWQQRTNAETSTERYGKLGCDAQSRQRTTSATTSRQADVRNKNEGRKNWKTHSKAEERERGRRGVEVRCPWRRKRGERGILLRRSSKLEEIIDR